MEIPSQQQQDLKGQVVDKAKDQNEDEILDILLNQKSQKQVELSKNIRSKKSQGFDDFLTFSLSFYEGVTIKNQPLKDIILNKSLTKTTKNQLHLILQQHGFIIMNQEKKRQSHSNSFQVKVVFHSQFYDVVEILCQLGPFTKRYIILNQKKQSFRHQNKLIGMGAFGKLYCCHSYNDQTQSVFKCIGYNENDFSFLKDTIKEFFICDMMSALKIGPKILKRSGFDFILFSNCIEFEMEMCEPFKVDTVEKDTKQSLFLMHILKIIHFDIKPANIMYSPKYKKNVLLDFGISQIIDQRWGRKTLTKFKGTYEFCGQQMRKIFIKRQQQFVDLFLNDVIMLKNSIKYFLKDQLIQRQLNQSSARQINPDSQKQKTIFQQIVRLKYHLYINQFSSKITDEFEQFLKELNKFQPSKDVKKIIKEGLIFEQKIQTFSLKKLVKEFISKHPQLKYFQIQADSQKKVNFYKHELKHNFEQRQHIGIKKIQIIFHKIENQSQNIENSEYDDEGQLQLKNIEFILLNKNQLQKLTNQQKYQLYLSYCQFWKPKYLIQIDKKNQISQIFQESIKGKSEDIQAKSQSEDSQNSCSQIIKNPSPKLILIYSSILINCKNSKFNDFSEKFMMVALKNCIFLQFQYFKFMKNYVTHYFKCLIKKKSKKLITLMVVEFMELNFLTQNHFLTTNQQNSDAYKNKHFFICSNQIIQELVKQMKNLYSQNEQYYQKIKTMQILWETLLNEEQIKHSDLFESQKFIQNVNKIVQMIEKQLSDHSIKEIISLSSIAISYIYCTVKQKNRIFQLNLSFESKLTKFYDDEKNRIWGSNFLSIKSLSNLNQIQVTLKQFDRKVGCYNLSYFFFIPFRMKVFMIKEEFSECQKNTFSIFYLKIHPSINYKVILQIIPDLVIYYVFDDQNLKNQTQNLFIFYYCQLLKFFFQNKQSQKCNQCLLCIKQSYQPISKYLLESNLQLLKSTLIEIKQHDVSNKHKYLINNILLELYDDYSVDYLKTKKEIFSLFLQTVKKNYKILSQQNCYFEELCISNLFLQDKILNLWQNMKLSYILGVYPLENQYYNFLRHFFVKTKKFQCLFEMMMMLAQKGKLLTNSVTLINILDSFYCYRKELELDDSLFDSFYEFFKKEYKTNHDEKKLILLLCGLKISGFLKHNLVLWKKLLSDFYDLYESIKRNKKNSQFIIKFINKQLYILSYQFIKTKNKNQRKLLCLMRLFLKSIFPGQFEEQQHYYHAFQYQIYKIICSKSKCNPKNTFLMKIYQKLQKYTGYCPCNSDSTNDDLNYISNIRKQQKSEYYLYNIRRYQKSQYLCYETVNKNAQVMVHLNTRDYLLAISKIYQWNEIKPLKTSKMKSKTYQKRHPHLLQNVLLQNQNISVETIKDKIFTDWFKNSQEYQLCEDIIDIMDEIFSLIKRKLLHQIKEKNLSKLL